MDHLNRLLALGRLVRTDLMAGDQLMWRDVIPEHGQNLLQWAALLKVQPTPMEAPCAKKEDRGP